MMGRIHITREIDWDEAAPRFKPPEENESR